MQYKETLAAVGDKAIAALRQVVDNGQKTYKEFTFDLETLRDFLSVNIMEDPEHKDTFIALREMKGPVLYWFEVMPGYNHAAIVDRLRNYQANDNKRATPAIKKHIDFNSPVLYVGKVKASFYGRVIQHLGFFPNSRTQGLQLFHWMQKEPLVVKLHACEFEPEMSDLVGLLENELAKDTKAARGKT